MESKERERWDGYFRAALSDLAGSVSPGDTAAVLRAVRTARLIADVAVEEAPHEDHAALRRAGTSEEDVLSSALKLALIASAKMPGPAALLFVGDLPEADWERAFEEAGGEDRSGGEG